MRYNQKDVATLLGLNSIGAISQWEKGTRLPNLVNMFKLSILYRTLPEVLFQDLVIMLREEVSAREKNKLITKKMKVVSNRIMNKENRFDTD